VALQKNKVNQLPVKLNKTKVRNRYFNYLVVIDSSNKTVLKQREGKGIWQNLWEFPLLETKKKINQKELEAGIKEVISINDSPEIYQFNTNDIIHKLSHQHLHTKFWILKTDTALKEGIQLGTLDQYPVPVLIADFIKTFKI